MCCLSRMRCPRCMIYTSKIEANRAFWYRVGVGIIPTEPCRTFGLRVLRVLRVATAGFFLSSVPHCESATAAFFLSFTVTPSSSDWFRCDDTPINVEEDLEFLEQIELDMATNGRETCIIERDTSIVDA
ncbi:uncharacterized protein LOC107807800 isoform X3 [Nicotiana tabacum]|uniref:Uncharacterized protein LOC107807800 isoform X3 n=1 Tax=Nicotiana tabacum TaxID=4097 RepID=A0AC58UMA9_TOBAC